MEQLYQMVWLQLGAVGLLIVILFGLTTFLLRVMIRDQKLALAAAYKIIEQRNERITELESRDDEGRDTAVILAKDVTKTVTTFQGTMEVTHDAIGKMAAQLDGMDRRLANIERGRA